MQLGKHWSTVLATAIGLGLAVVVVRSTNFAALQVTASKVGLAAPAVFAIRIGVIVLAGLAWAPLVISARHVRLAVLVGLRFVREAVNVMLPVAAMGGDVVGGRLLTRWSVRPAAAAASILSDLTLQFFTQLLFAALGIVVLAISGKSEAVVAWASTGVAVGALALAGFVAVQRFGLFRWTEVDLEWVARAASLAARLRENLRATYARPRKLALAVGLHFAAWLLGTLETFAVLLAIGIPSLAAALVIESLGQAIRATASPVPGALGVQEGGYILLVGLFGMPPETGLALSLTKRIPDLLIGTAGLIAWLGLESGHLGPSKVTRAEIPDGANEDASA